MRRATPRPADLRCRSTRIHQAAVEALETRQLLSAGYLDSSFGDAGIQNIQTGPASYSGGAAVQSTGKIVVLTGIDANEVQRLQTNGETDTTFGTNGFATLPNPGSTPYDYYTNITVESDDKIIAYGPDVIARLNANGSVDTTFGGTGVINTPATYLAVQSNDAIVVSEAGNFTSYSSPSVYRINGNGLRDGSFNNNTGSADLPIDTSNGYTEIGAVAITASQQIIVSVVQGETPTDPYEQSGYVQSQFGVVRLLASGAVDTTFGTNGLGLNSNGIDIYPTQQADWDMPAQVAVDSNGAIYQLGGASDDNMGADGYELLAYTPNGATAGDDSNGMQGVGTVGLGASSVSGFAIQPNNKVVTLAAETTSLDTGGNYLDLHWYQAYSPANQTALLPDTSFNNGSLDGNKPGESDIAFPPVDSGDNGSGDIVTPESIVTAPNGQLIIGALFQGSVSNIQRIAAVDQSTSSISSGAVSGFVFADNDKSGAWDTNEPGIQGITVYDDLNNNGKLDAGEPSTTTNASGQYTLTNVPTGAQIIRQEVPPGTNQTDPTGALGRHITVTPAGVSDLAFGLFTPNVQDTSYSNSGVGEGVGFLDSTTVIAVQNGGDVITLCETQTAFYLQRLLPSGALDTSFGTNGSTAMITFSGGQSGNPDDGLGPGPLAIAPNGNIVVSAGEMLASFTANGATDTSFGNGAGYVALQGFAVGIAFQSNGKIVVSIAGGVISRYTAAGVLDTTYGDGGDATVYAPQLPDGSIGQIVVNSADQAIVTFSGDPSAALAASGVVGGFALLRFNTDGTLDSTFGTNGVALESDSAYHAYDGPNDTGANFDSLAIARNGTLFQTANYDPLDGDESDLLAAGPDGQLLSSVYLPTLLSNIVGYSTQVDLTGLATQADNKLVAVGVLDDANGDSSAELVMRFNPNLTLDTSFNGDGVALIHIAGGGQAVDYHDGDFATSVALQSNGNIFVGGFSRGIINNLTGADVQPVNIYQPTVLRLIGGPISTPTTTTISGTVYADANKDGTQDNGEAGLAGLQVYIDQNNLGYYVNADPSTTTDASGNYSFNVAAPGTYIVRAVAPAGYTQITPTDNYGHHVSVATNAAITGENFGFYQPQTGGQISGAVTLSNGNPAPAGWTVYIDANNNGQLDSGETSTLLSATGGYSFSGLSAGAYIVRVAAPPGFTQITPSNDYGHHVSLTADQTVSGDNFVFQSVSTATISGAVTNGKPGETIYLDANNNSVRDAGELSTTLSASDTFSFSNVPAGAYIIRQVLPAGYKQTSPSNGYGIHITVASGANLTGENFADAAPPTSTASISGTVYNDANGNGLHDSGETGLSGWTVYLDLDNTGSYAPSDPTTTTDASGDYTFSDLAAGSYIVRVEEPSVWVQTSPSNNYGHHLTLADGQLIGAEDFEEFEPMAKPA